MTAKDSLKFSLDMAEMVTKSYLADLTAADLMMRPVPGQNHIAWQIGHLLLSEQSMLNAVKPGSSPALPEGFEEGHGREKHAVDDASKYHAPADYLRLLNAQREATKRVLAEATDAELDAPAPENFRRMCPTAGAIFGLIAAHELMHVGQYVAVRRTLGKAIAM